MTNIFTSSGAVHGGLAAAPDGAVFFTTLASGANTAKLTALNSTDTVRWTWSAPSGAQHNMYAIPSYDSTQNRVFVGSDAGIFYCFNASNGQIVWSPTVVVSTNPKRRRIRSGAALDLSHPSGPTVYFQANDGYLYALDAADGSLRWKRPTGNLGPEPVVNTHTEPFSSSPVVGGDGTIYVASSSATFYAFSPSGVELWTVPLQGPAEASPAIAANGFVYVGTRTAGGTVGALHAINPAMAGINPNLLIQWCRDIPRNAEQEFVGYLASPVVDQSGHIYAAAFGELVLKHHPENGSVVHEWLAGGKICQTPTINQDGLLIVGVSRVLTPAGVQTGNNRVEAFRILDHQSSGPWWGIGEIQTTSGSQPLGASIGSMPIRAITSGRAYFSDMTGRIGRFDTGAPLMAGEWPTFQCGNRRVGKSLTYSWTLAELPAFYGLGTNYASQVAVRSVDGAGRAVGQAYGFYNYPYSSEFGLAAAYWRNLVVRSPSFTHAAPVNSFATAISGAGHIIGYVTGSGGGPRVWPEAADLIDQQPLVLPTPGYSYGYAADINSQNKIVGYAQLSGFQIHVFRWTPSGLSWGWQNLGATPGGNTYAYAISDTERIVGKARFSPGSPWHAFTTQEQPFDLSLAVDLGTFGGSESVAWDVHDQSGIVGWAHIAGGRRRAFKVPVTCTGMIASSSHELPPLPGVTGSNWNSEAYSVNRYGEVVGQAQTDAGTWRAFRYVPGLGMEDLNSLVPAGSGWVLMSAKAINDAGIIVGTGTRNGVGRSWILFPQAQD